MAAQEHLNDRLIAKRKARLKSVAGDVPGTGRATTGRTAARGAAKAFSSSASNNLLLGFISEKLGQSKSALGELSETDLRALAEDMVRIVPTSSETQDRMLAAAGPFYDTPALSRWLGVRRQALDKRVHKRQLLGLPSEEGPRFYPTAQFHNDRGVLAGLKEVLDVLNVSSDDPWVWALWLSGTSDGEDGKTGWQQLREGNQEAVLEAARRAAARWAE